MYIHCLVEYMLGQLPVFFLDRALKSNYLAVKCPKISYFIMPQLIYKYTNSSNHGNTPTILNIFSGSIWCINSF